MSGNPSTPKTPSTSKSIELFKFDESRHWEVDYKISTLTEQRYSATLHNVNPPVYQKLLKIFKVTVDTIEEKKREMEKIFKCEMILNIPGHCVHATNKSDGTREAIKMVQIWTFHGEFQVTTFWPDNPLTGKRELKRHAEQIKFKTVLCHHEFQTKREAELTALHLAQALEELERSKKEVNPLKRKAEELEDETVALKRRVEELTAENAVLVDEKNQTGAIPQDQRDAMGYYERQDLMARLNFESTNNNALGQAISGFMSNAQNLFQGFAQNVSSSSSCLNQLTGFPIIQQQVPPVAAPYSAEWIRQDQEQRLQLHGGRRESTVVEQKNNHVVVRAPFDPNQPSTSRQAEEAEGEIFID